MALELKGAQGKSVVEGSNVRIIKAGGVFSAKREKSLPIKSISTVEVKNPGLMPGFIQFSIAGGRALNSSTTLTGGYADAANDENSVVFPGCPAYDIALQIKAYIEQYTEPSPSIAPGAQISVADEISKLKRLLDDGVLTQAEFDGKKKQLLGL